MTKDKSAILVWRSELLEILLALECIRKIYDALGFPEDAVKYQQMINSLNARLKENADAQEDH